MNKQNKSRDSDPKQPLSLKELAIIVVSGHLGVRKREHRVTDFARANGFHVFLGAALYFMLLIAALIVLVIYIAS